MAEADSIADFHRRREPVSAWLGIVLLFAVFGLLVWTIFAATPRTDNFEQKRAAARTEKLKAVRNDADKGLNGYAWVDKTKGVARVPIDRAMELTMNDLAQRKPAPAGPIDVAQTPGGAQQGAPATSGAAPPAPAAAAASATPKPIAIEGPASENRAQNAAAANPPGAAPKTQPGAAATPAASPPAPSGNAPSNPAASPNATPVQSPPGTPLPVPGKSP